MVVFPLYAMILITFLSQSSVKVVQGLKCYQCEHPGLTPRPCESKPCDIDQFHRELKIRYENATKDLNMIDTDNNLQIEELCFRRLHRPIPFDRTVRGCFINLKFRGVSKGLESKKAPMYEEWKICRKDNCNDWDLPKRGKARRSARSSGRNNTQPTHLSKLTVLPLLLIINYLHCFYYYYRV